ncbi:MAG: 50S ribosomal protein L18, partial [bacterium]|nr:50S ribosomal protein L18 [bacterium]
MKAPQRIKRTRRQKRIRARIQGTAARPRLSVFRSNKHLFVQLIDDEAGKTLCAVLDGKLSEAKAGEKVGRKVRVAHTLGVLIAEKAKAKGITRVVFDRGGYAYHGRVAAVADGAREGGL